MNIEVFNQASLAVQVHIILALVAILVSPAILVLKKGSKLHKLLGKFWALIMLGLALGSFGINSFDMPYGVSPIHIVSVIVLISVPLGVYHIRRGNLRGHKQAMLGTMIGGILGAGLPALLSPDRALNLMFFGS